MEVFKVIVTTEDKGVYNLGITECYSVGGEEKKMLLGTVSSCVFINWKAYIDLIDRWRN